MRNFAAIALWSYIPFIVLLFALVKNKRHALIAAFIIGWEFLPMDMIRLQGFSELSKVTACSMGAMLGAVLFDTRRLLSFRPHWFDLPMLVWCFCPFVTSMKLELGPLDGMWDGASAAYNQVAMWGIPYFLGRVYFDEWNALRELAIGIFIGGLVYVPFCLFEIKMSPQLHKIVYGHFQHDFSQTKRWGGYRPMVFMQQGIALGMWMCVASMIGIWLWLSGAIKQLWRIRMGTWVAVLLATTVLCKSLTGLLFLAAGLGTLFWIKWFRNALPLYILVALAPAYMYIRASGMWDGQNLIDAAEKSAGEERAQSLGTRIKAENLLTKWALHPEETEHARECPLDLLRHDPWWGWGKWSPYTTWAPWRVGHMVHHRNPDTGEERPPTFKDDAPTDGMWVITLGTFGLVGLISLTVTILLPVLLLRLRLPLRAWSHPIAAAAAVMALVLALHMLDDLLNAMLNPIYVLAIGSLSALGTKRSKWPRGSEVPYAAPYSASPAYGFAPPTAFPAQAPMPRRAVTAGARP